MKAFLRCVFPICDVWGEISAIATVHKAGTGSRAIKLERFRWSTHQASKTPRPWSSLCLSVWFVGASRPASCCSFLLRHRSCDRSELEPAAVAMQPPWGLAATILLLLGVIVGRNVALRVVRYFFSALVTVGDVLPWEVRLGYEAPVRTIQCAICHINNPLWDWMQT